eukprot:m.18280 g.18280  ORF g.18280 m.18280 type:complete len:733 (+) comp8285_c0_seq1:38-2236(+)
MVGVMDMVRRAVVGGSGAGATPQWYKMFMTLSFVASLFWSVIVCVVVCFFQSAISTSFLKDYITTTNGNTLFAVPVLVVLLILHYRNTYKLSTKPLGSVLDRYVVVLFRLGNLQIFTLHTLLAVSFAMTTTFLSPVHTSMCTKEDMCVHDLVILRFVVAVISAWLVTVEYIQYEEDVLVFPAQQGGLLLRNKTALRIALSRAFATTVRLIPVVAIGYVICGLFPHQKKHLVAAVTGAVFGHSQKPIVFTNIYEIYDVGSLLVIGIPAFSTAFVSLATRMITQVYLTSVTKSIGSGASLDQFTKAIGPSMKNNHIKRLALTSLCLILRQNDNIVSEYFSSDGAGKSQFSCVSDSCLQIVASMISKLNLNLGMEVKLRISSRTSSTANANRGQTPFAGKDTLASNPSVGILSQIPAKHSVLTNFVLWVRKLQLRFRVEGAWFQPSISQMDALYMLCGQSDGMFVVHSSDQVNTLAITVVHDAFNSFPPRHSVSAWTSYICYENNKYFLHYEFEKKFGSVESLVKYYQTYPYTLDFARNERRLCRYDQAQYLAGVRQKSVVKAKGSAWNTMSKIPVLSSMVAKPTPIALEKHLGDVDIVCAALELIGQSFEMAGRTKNFPLRQSVGTYLEVWSFALSKLFVAVDEECKKASQKDNTVVDNITHRRIRVCVPSSVAPLQGVIHGTTSCMSRILVANPENNFRGHILCEIDRKFLSLLSQGREEDLRHLPQQRRYNI